MTVLVFDIETIPDIETGKKLFDLEGLSPEDIGKAMFAQQRAKSGSEFLPHYLQRVVAISLILVQGSQIRVWSLGDEQSDEKDLINRFFNGVDKYVPTLVSWNGCGFDLPVLHYRALYQGITASTYWENGEHQNHFKWNNYLSRYHYRHLDIMDVLASYQSKAYAPLDNIAVMLGFPGKMGMSGSKVWEYYLKDEIKPIRDYCETDVLNTYCVYLRFELMRGIISQQEYQQAMQHLKTYLAGETQRLHLQEFLQQLA